jgi:hypothetical protein
VFGVQVEPIDGVPGPGQARFGGIGTGMRERLGTRVGNDEENVHRGRESSRSRCPHTSGHSLSMIE